MTLELGNNVYRKEVNIDKDGFALMKQIKVFEGKYDLTPFFSLGRKNILPFWIEIERL